MPTYPSDPPSLPVRNTPSALHSGLQTRWLVPVALWCLAGQATVFAQCLTPGGLSALEVTTSALTLEWVDPGNADSVEFEVRIASQPFTGSPTHTGYTLPWTISGLNAATRHRIRLRSVCGQQRSAWSTLHLDVTTAAFNPSPCGLFFRIDDDNCPAYNTFYLEVDQAPGQQLGRDVVLSSVDLIIRHTFLADLHLTLVSPSGQEVRLFKEHGQSRDHLGNPADPSCTQVCRFSSRDCAALDPVAHTGAFTGTFRPDEDLHLFDDGSNPQGIWQLRICDDARADTGSLRSLALIFEPLECPAVYDVRANKVTESTAELVWALSGDPEAVIIEYGPPGFSPGMAGESGPGGQLEERPGQMPPGWTLSGLDPGTSYDVYLRSRCAGGSYAPNTCVLTLHTDCATGAPVAHQENFDALSPCGPVCPCGTVNPLSGLWRNVIGQDDLDWLTRHGPANNEIQTGPSEDISGTGNYLFLQTLQAACQNGARASLQTSCLAVDLDPDTQCHLAFHYHMWGAAMGTLTVEASRDGGGLWEPCWTLSGNQGRSWHKTYVDLGKYRGDTIQLRITGISGPARTSQMALDELLLYGVELLGDPDQIWYRDEDEDGFGNPQRFVRTCNSLAPPGYVANAMDCDDANPAVHPGAPELPCNGVDENCNGMADDRILPAPQPVALSVCEGEVAFLSLSSPLIGEAFWYADPSRQVLLGQGPSLFTGPLDRDTIFWVLDTVPQAGCASAPRPVPVNVNPRPQLILPFLPGYCQGDSLDLADLPILDEGKTGAAFTWHTGSPPSSQNALSNTRVMASNPALWTVLARSPQDCTDEADLTFPVWPTPSVYLQPADTLYLCARQASLAVAQAGGGLPPYQYQWSNGFSQFFAPVLAGINPGWQQVQVTVTDSRGCQVRDQLALRTMAAPLALTAIVTDVSSCGGEDGTIHLTPDGPGPYHYFWSGPSQGQAFNLQEPLPISGLKQGSYRITITDALTLCDLVLPSVVVNGPGPVVKDILVQAETCPDAGNGAISLVMEGPPADFQWSNGQQGPLVTGLTPGTYSVTITGGACTFQIMDLEVAAAAPLVLGTVIRPVTCAGGQDGEIHITLSGGVGPYAFQWVNGATTQDLVGVPAGAYDLTVTDANGCTYESGELAVPAAPVLEVQVQLAAPACSGSSDGWIRLLIQGGQPSYQVLWSDGGAGRERPGLAAGDYRFTITDQAGCTLTGGPLTLSGPALLQAQWVLTRNETCQGAVDGLLSAQVSGGAPPYQFMWGDGATDSLRTGLAAGSYSLTVLDQRSCQVMLPMHTLYLESPLTLHALKSKDPRCDALADGRIELQVSGGSGSYSWLWSNGSAEPELTGVGAGNYSVTVSDVIGCTAMLAGLVLTEESPLQVLVQGVYFPQCGLGSEGEIVLSVFGTAPYSYAWSSGYNGSNPTGLSPGFYSVTVQDALGCIQAVESIPVINTEDQYTATFTEVRHSRCHGDRNGSVVVEIRGGRSPYQFNWSNGQEKDVQLPVDGIDELAPGWYSVTITDDRGCVLSAGPVQVAEPMPLTLNVPAAQIGNETCLGAADGMITLDINGGVSPYTTLWFKDSLLHATEQSPRNLPPGRYTVYVEDKQGCAKSLIQAIEIYGPPSLMSWQHILVADDECTAEGTGTIELKMTGGVPEYTYRWADGADSRIRTGLDGGWHCVTVTDQFLCRRDTCVLVPGGSGIALELEVLDECDPYSSAEATPLGGVSPYSWLWSHGDTSSSPQGLPTGTYSLTVTDGLGCAEVVRDIQIGHPILYIETAYSIPASPGHFDGMAIVVPRGGTPPYTIQWDVNTGSQIGDTAFFLSPGTFCVLVTDAYQCFDTVCVQVGLSTSLDVARMESTLIKLSPNPARSLVVLEWLPETGSPAVGLILFSAPDGRQWSLPGGWPAGWRALRLDLPDLPAGLYGIQVFNTDGQQVMADRVILLGP